MRKIISLLVATSTLISSYWAVNFQNKETVPVEENKQIVLSEETVTDTIHIFKPTGLEFEKYTDGFSFDLHKKMIELKSDLFFQNFKSELAAKEAQKLAEQQAKIAEEKKKAEAIDTQQKASTQSSKPVASTVKNSSSTKPATGTAEQVSPKPAPAPSPAPAPAPAPAPVPAPEPVNTNSSSYDYLSNVEKEILTVTNRYRSENGLAPLTWDSSLYDSARSHSALMFTTNTFKHTTKYNVGENIYMLASGDKSKYSAEFIVAKWMNSEGHRANILNPKATRMGAGVVLGQQYFEKYSRNLPTIYATQHFK